LIFDIFQDGIKHCLDKFINLNEDQYDEYWELSYEMYDAKKEKTRIKKLLSPEYTNIPNQPTLTAHCNELLVGIGKKEESNLSQALYATRNNIVHAYRLFKEPQKDKLKILLPEFVNLIIDILITYKR